MKVRIICSEHNDAVVVPLDGRSGYDWLVYSAATTGHLSKEDYHLELDLDDLLCTGAPDVQPQHHEFWLEVSDFKGFTVPKHGTMRIGLNG